MGIQDDLNTVRLFRKSLFHVTMLTSMMAVALSASSGAAADDSILINQNRPGIPYCDGAQERTIGRRLLFVTTLDGRLSALDISKGGKLRWSIPTGPGPLISSSIHRLELTNNGQFVRMIPSLSGGIYKFDGESIDPIPITTENLLSSSAKFSDDLVISGGKETRTYGVCVRTGNLLYECSMHGCINSTNSDAATSTTTDSRSGDEDKAYLVEHDPLIDDVIVIRRQTQTVRAVESRTGIERWNFSVGQHDLDIIRSSECHDRHLTDMDMAVLDIDIRVIVPEGIICAFSKSNPGTMLWKYKFDHPIVSGWKIGEADELESIDMFSSAQWFWDNEENIFDTPYPSITPSVYLGMYNKQLYIQESINLRKEILDQSNLYTHLTTESPMPKIPWRPIPASSNSLVVFQDDKIINEQTVGPTVNEEIHGNELVEYHGDNFALSAQSVLNASEYVNGNGFYLYTRADLNKTESSLCENKVPAIEGAPMHANNTNQTVATNMDFNLDDIDVPAKVVILSLWFWWKEIVVIAFTSAVLLNLMLGQRSRGEREIVVIERHVPVPTAMEATESSTAALLGPTSSSSKSLSNGYLKGQRSLSESTNHSGEHFTSRFLSDFDLVRCLGKGGFGVVFEAKNKLDDCKYAVKRITLPNKKESRDRVMREVKTLANCEHHNIVRYFQAWVETPPPGWQEEEDNKWLQHEMSTSIQIDTPEGTYPSYVSSLAAPHTDNRLHNNVKKQQLMSWVSSVASTACSSDFDCDKRQIAEEDDDDDSMIIFRSESQSLAMREEQEDDESVTESVNSKNERNNQVKEAHAASAITIDIHSKSFNLMEAHKAEIDYSQLSDSFQIEFVRSMSQEQDVDEKEESGNVVKTSKSESLQKDREVLTAFCKENNNNCRALVPALVASTPKPAQNKVYLYIQMQLCRKECLRDWLRENKMDARESQIASIFHQIVDAVDYVHLKGLIHRDLKPSNIFFSQDGQIKIGDFGLVTDMSDIPNLITKCSDKSGLPSCARHTEQVGTHLYMSPEQLRGKHYDHKVDIYSLGLIFFELLVYFCTEMERIVTLRDLRDGRYPKDFPVARPSEYSLLQQMLSSKPDERPSTPELKMQLNSILKLPDWFIDNIEANALARRLSRSRTFSTSE